MRWEHEDQPLPIGGETRSRFVFAWKQTRVGKYTVWLERYEVHETYFQPASGGAPGWWIETSRNTAEKVKDDLRLL